MKVDGCFLGGFSNPAKVESGSSLDGVFFVASVLKNGKLILCMILRGDFVTFVDFLFW